MTKDGHLYGWRHWLWAMRAIFLKDVRVFLRYPLNAVMRLIEPLLFAAPAVFLSRVFGTGGGFASYAGTSDYVAFLVIGGIVSGYVSSVFWGMGFALKSEMDVGVLESNWLMPVPPVVQLVGRSLFAVAHTTVNTIFICAAMYYLFGFTFVGRLVPAVITMVPLLVGLYGLGIGLAGLVLVTNNANLFVDIGNYLLTALSGQSFPVSVLPRPLLVVSLALPLTYAYDVLRGLLLGTRTILPIAQEQVLLTALVLVTTVPGYLLFRRVERHCREIGALARH